MLRNINIDLIYQPTLTQLPANPEELQARAASNDKPTMAHWRDTWIAHIKDNKEKYGSFYDHSIGKLHGINKHKTAIVIGSGPSLAQSLNGLRANAKMKNPLLTVSCLHNFGYFMDEGIDADYYLTLDAGEIVVRDVFEGRQQPPEFYWEKTAGKKLLAYVGTSPNLLKLWQGEVFFFNTPLPDMALQAEIDAIEKFQHCISSGGNALGACMYAAKVIMGSPTIVFVGADFCFDYDNTFHAYKTHYDEVGQFVLHPDVFGVPRKTWQSYLNFKFWLDRISMTVPGVYVNASFGCLGAYMGGNLGSFIYRSLDDWLIQYEIAESVTKYEKVDGAEDKKSLLWLDDYFSSRTEGDKIVLF
jgi:hypothetical protein